LGWRRRSTLAPFVSTFSHNPIAGIAVGVLAGIDVDPEAELRTELKELAGADDDRGLAARQVMNHASDRSDAFLLRILRERRVSDVPTDELKRIGEALDANATAKAAEFEAFINSIPAVDA
jgi:hypothetical protein